jgi:hypothetical protein
VALLLGRQLPAEQVLEELNARLGEWSATVADQRIHGTTHERPAERFARAEAAELIAVDARPPAPRERITTRVVPRDGLVAVEANRYPVPLSWVGLILAAVFTLMVGWYRRRALASGRGRAGGRE